MSALKREGLEAVASWTVNKKINVFEKKLIFIPINADLHWSLCVVVNPGHVANNFNNEISLDQECSW
jgi:Ulp1 family protease